VSVEIFVDMIMRQRRHPEQGYRSCLGVIRLAKTFGHDRLDAACVRALELNAHSYTSLHSILKNGLDRKTCTSVTEEPAITHPNIRHTKGVPILMGSAPLAQRADYFH
jgi:transposase